MNDKGRRIMVTGGAGYVGALLTPRLLDAGWRVRVLDLLIYGREPLAAVADHPNLEIIEGDIRDPDAVRRAVADCDAAIHLACISNDPSFELDPQLGKSINFDSLEPLVQAARDAGVRRFIYASSSSVYGIKREENVNEDMPLEPLTDYSKFKAMGERVVQQHRTDEFVTVVLRPATLCGYSPRQRLDLTVNILTNHAVNNGVIKVFGGEQKRPNLHVDDMIDAYLHVLGLPDEAVAGKVWNVSRVNHTVRRIAEIIREIVGPDRVELATVPTDDQRSYHVSAGKIEREVGFTPKRGVEDAVRDLIAAFDAGRLPNSMTDPLYFNIKRMQELNLT